MIEIAIAFLAGVAVACAVIVGFTWVLFRRWEIEE